jgi:hypothetical protein
MQYVEECGDIHPPTSYGVSSYDSSGDTILDSETNWPPVGHGVADFNQHRTWPRYWSNTLPHPHRTSSLSINPFKRYKSAKLPSLHNFFKFDLCDLEKYVKSKT